MIEGELKSNAGFEAAVETRPASSAAPHAPASVSAPLPAQIPRPRPAQPRAIGEARVAASGPDSRLSGLRQSGSAKALLPFTAAPWLEAVLLNTAGGVTGGDRISWGGAAEDGARLSVSTQTAERAYRAQPGETGHVTSALTVGAGSRLDWLPQETILFEGSALSRRLEADLAPDAVLLACEAVIFGRAAMGEVLNAFSFRDEWRLRRDGKLFFADALHLAGAGALHDPFRMGGAGAMATAILAGPDAQTLAPRLRAALEDAPKAGVSLGDGFLLLRILADDGRDLRRRLIPALSLLRGAALPKVWTL